MNHEILNTPEFTPDFSLLAFLSWEIQSTKEYVRNYQGIMQNKPNFRKAKMNVSNVITRNYTNFIPLAGYKNKPNQTQFPKSQNECKLIFYRGLQKKR